MARFLLTAGVLLSLLLQSACAVTRDERIATLVARNCGAITRMALSPADPKEKATSSGLIADVWVTGEFIPEIRITLWEANDGVRAEVARTTEELGTVCSQLLKLYGSSSSLTPEEASKMVKVAVRVHPESLVPELRQLFDQVRGLRVTAELSDSIFLPGRGVSMSVTNGFERMSVDFSSPEPTAGGVAFSGNPAPSQPQVSEWVDRLLRTLHLP